MKYLKEDGCLDVERIYTLPCEEYITLVENMTDSEYIYLKLKTPISERCNFKKGMVVDYNMEDEINRGTGVILSDYIERLKRELNT